MSTKAERRARDMLMDRGCLVVRAAGSMGSIDLLAAREDATWVIEVKEAGRSLADGTVVLYLTDKSGRAVDQRDELQRIQERHPWTRCGFLLRAKGRWLPDHCHRWSWHAATKIGTDTVLRSDQGITFNAAFGLPVTE